jgi:hypothetical protein
MPLLHCGTYFFEEVENDTQEADMAPVTHAAALYPKTDSNPDPGLLAARRLAGERDPQHPLGSHRSVSPLTAFTE